MDYIYNFFNYLVTTFGIAFSLLKVVLITIGVAATAYTISTILMGTANTIEIIYKIFKGFRIPIYLLKLIANAEGIFKAFCLVAVTVFNVTGTWFMFQQISQNTGLITAIANFLQNLFSNPLITATGVQFGLFLLGSTILTSICFLVLRLIFNSSLTRKIEERQNVIAYKNLLKHINVAAEEIEKLRFGLLSANEIKAIQESVGNAIELINKKNYLVQWNV